MEDKKHHYRVLLGNSIKRRRQAIGMSLHDFAAMVNVNHAHLWNVENGRVGITVDLLVKIAEGLEVKVHDLIEF